jgi:hypothetical protein
LLSLLLRRFSQCVCSPPKLSSLRPTVIHQAADIGLSLRLRPAILTQTDTLLIDVVDFTASLDRLGLPCLRD